MASVFTFANERNCLGQILLPKIFWLVVRYQGLVLSLLCVRFVGHTGQGQVSPTSTPRVVTRQAMASQIRILASLTPCLIVLPGKEHPDTTLAWMEEHSWVVPTGTQACMKMECVTHACMDRESSTGVASPVGLLMKMPVFLPTGDGNAMVLISSQGESVLKWKIVVGNMHTIKYHFPPPQF